MIEFRIEGLNPAGEWVMLDRPLPVEGDHQAHRAEVIASLRRHGITQYSSVRLMKYVTTAEQVGQEITV